MNNKIETLQLSFLTLGIKYLHTAENILEELVASGNQHVVFGDYGTSENYSEITKWSDFNVLIPTLFIFYHGVELVLKGLLLIAKASSEEKIEANHNLEKLLSDIIEKYSEQDELIKILKKYIHCNSKDTPELIAKLIETNDELKNIEDLYHALRYPSNKVLENAFNYSESKYKEKEGLKFAKDLIQDINRIRRITVSIYRNKQK